MDIALIRELFTNCIRAAEVLDADKILRDELRASLARLRPYAVGSKGQLEEWPVDFADAEPAHRHVSHLYGVFPGEQISTRATPELAAAARRTLNLRGDQATGWSLAWKINLWSRLGDGDRAHQCLALLLSPERSYPNLFDSCPPFQIDGNFGAAAGIIEMLLHSEMDEIELLPALPGTWPQGSFAGLRAKGGYTVGCVWEDNRLTAATISADRTTTCRLRYGATTAVFACKRGEEIGVDGFLNPTPPAGEQAPVGPAVAAGTPSQILRVETLILRIPQTRADKMHYSKYAVLCLKSDFLRECGVVMFSPQHDP